MLNSIRFRIALVAVPLAFFPGCAGSPAAGDVTDPVDSTATDVGADTSGGDVSGGDVSDSGPVGAGWCDDPSVRIVGVNPWPGGGIQVYVHGGDSESPFSMMGPTGLAVPVEAAPAPQEGGIVGILVQPSADAAIHQARLDVAAQLVESLNPSYRVAAWQVRDKAQPQLLFDLSAARSLASEKIGRIASSDVGLTAFDVNFVRGLLAGAEGRWGALVRDVVVISDGSVPDGLSVGGSLDPAPKVGAVFLGDQPVAGLLSDTALIRRVGACPGAAEGDSFTLTVGAATCVVTAPKPMMHLAGLECRPDQAAADFFPFGDTIELVMTPEQESVWQQRHEQKSKDDFELSVILGAGEPIPAMAHFRGQTSMDCQRKNYDVNLEGGQSRRLMPGGGGDEFFLISMCKDEGFFNQVFANRLMAAWDLFPLKSRLVRLRVNGANHGLYLMMQEPSDTLVKAHVALDGIVRRPFEPDPREQYEVKHSASGDIAAVLQRYLDLVQVAQNVDSPAALADLRDRLDLPSYLRWMAVMTFLHNGDYVDEVFFYGSFEAGGKVFWRPMNWDADDLFSQCHHGGVKALPDDWGMLYCAEGFIDQAIVESPEVYEEWVDILSSVMESLDAATATEIMNGVRDDLFALLDDETAAALVEFHASFPEAVTSVGARTAIQGLMNQMLSAIESSRATLGGKIQAYREGVAN
ncbi:MAG TPA: CotH kinase family protein [Myxococcota bacterium]|nr:CotH kinase family protein [Myxococcota bacterium]